MLLIGGIRGIGEFERAVEEAPSNISNTHLAYMAPERDKKEDEVDDKVAGKKKAVKVEKVVVGRLQTNCWLVWDADSGQGMVIDPGSKWKNIMSLIKKNGVKVTAIVHTHGHGDHIAATLQVLENTSALLYRHPSQLGVWGARYIWEKFPDRVRDINDDDELKVGPFCFNVIHTPGHSPGGISLYGEGMLFSGDLLFKGSVGRYDLKGSDLSELKESLFKRIAHLPDDTKVFPGHGPSTTLAEERKTNPCFRPNWVW